MSDTGMRWAAAGVILVLLGAAFIYGKQQGEQDMMVEWAKETDTRLKEVEISAAANAKGLERVQQIMQKFFVAHIRPEPDVYPQTRWSDKTAIPP